MCGGSHSVGGRECGCVGVVASGVSSNKKTLNENQKLIAKLKT
ncbi:hypothetical protein [Campylobacter ureolyticus]|uniref:Uncharacterized protein n=1 Tax=Campylobacter ureolyticus TaxID=827 RepID=A0A9Q4PXT5_9BACT|nr:hypothetical protein [Campylobacter ureolyticus]MCZ6135188.1 hypothetical protein [Campylobacter ureolyticus]MCZ6162310.1 hypothetical protein [Campylobacter ureolyticus]